MQSIGELVDSLNFYKCSEHVKPKSKLKTRMGLAEEGGITIRGATTRILVFRATPKVLNYELHEEKSGLKDLKHRTLTKRASLGETHLHVCR